MPADGRRVSTARLLDSGHKVSLLPTDNGVRLTLAQGILGLMPIRSSRGSKLDSTHRSVQVPIHAAISQPLNHNENTNQQTNQHTPDL